MKIAVVGSRTWTDKEMIWYELGEWYRHLAGDMIIVSGGAEGADRIAEEWALFRKVPCTLFLPDWNKNGRAAGMIRNSDIISYADKVLAFWTGESKGTADSIQKALKMKKELHVYFMEPPTYPLEKPNVDKDVPFPVQGDE